MVRPTSAISEDVLHVRTTDVWMGVVSTKSPNGAWRLSWSAVGTFETSRDVRSSVAIGGKADIPQTRHFGSE
jgi:hypothetical protein